MKETKHIVTNSHSPSGGRRPRNIFALMCVGLLLCLPSILQAQELPDSLTAVVKDAATGEPIPYAMVYVSPSCGTIANYDGEFCLQCLPTDVLRISCMGYQRVYCKAAELSEAILMKPIASTLREVTVMATDDILLRLVRKMQKEARKHKKAVGRYFFRLTTQYPGTDELAEAFLSAKSCVQIRDITFHSGNRGLLSEGSLENRDLKGLGRTNMHLFLRLAPIPVNFDVWDIAYVPADIVLRRGRIYDVSCTAFKEDGTEICKITVTGDSSIVTKPLLEGSLYVDRKTCRLLHFDGQMRGLYLKAYDQARRRITSDVVQYTMHVDYRHDHGFTEIANMSGTIVQDKVMLRYLLFNLGDKEIPFKKSVRVEDNMLQTIDKVGFDSILWAMTGIVKRTRQEERVAFGDSTFFPSVWRGRNRMPDKSKYNVAPSAQEREANMYLRDAMRQLKGDAMQLHRGLPQQSVPPIRVEFVK